ncbi:MAG: hypothetical protein AABZ47_03450 [Planctomycetota bacterium]
MAQDPSFTLHAVKKNNMAITPTDSLLAVPGDTVEVEVYINCWSNGRLVHSDGTDIDPTQRPTMNAYQAIFNFRMGSFHSGSSGNVLPKDYATTTGINGRVCFPTFSGLPGDDNFANVFISQSHPDYMFGQSGSSICIVQSNDCLHRFSCTRFSGSTPAGFCPPPGTHDPYKYAGTLVLQVSPDATGVFTVCLDDTNRPPDGTMPPDFLDDGPENSFLVPYTENPVETTARIAPVEFSCLTIAVPTPECDVTINSVNPTNNTIDGRQPHALNDAATAQGITSVDLTYSIVNNPGGTNPPPCLSTGAFALASTSGTAPSVTSVTALTPNSVRLNLNRPIPAGAWTTITHDDDSGLTKFCLGNLPLDVNSNRTANADDVMRLVDCLAGTQSCSLVQGDTNRSGALNVGDIVQAINLANGADAFAVWNGAVLPASPCP